MSEGRDKVAVKRKQWGCCRRRRFCLGFYSLKHMGKGQTRISGIVQYMKEGYDETK